MSKKKDLFSKWYVTFARLSIYLPIYLSVPAFALIATMSSFSMDHYQIRHWSPSQNYMWTRWIANSLGAILKQYFLDIDPGKNFFATKQTFYRKVIMQMRNWRRSNPTSLKFSSGQNKNWVSYAHGHHFLW